jgi:hypothetical protein
LAIGMAQLWDTGKEAMRFCEPQFSLPDGMCAKKAFASHRAASPRGGLLASHKWVFALRIAYLIHTYPGTSHSFIRREIAAVERRGLQIQRSAMRSERVALRDAADLAEDDKTEHVLKTPAMGLRGAALDVCAFRHKFDGGGGAWGRAGRARFQLCDPRAGRI